jgi:small subunit ribosomal protein S5
MRFSALVVVGDKKGKVGFGIKKGLDFQDAVAKATKKAKENMIKVKLNDQHSLDFPSKTKFKAVEILLKPATQGTGVIAGGFVRPVLELAGVNNIYSKIFRSRNKFSGVQAVFKALETYK